MHTATQFKKCSNHQFEYKTYKRSLFLSYKTYKYDTHVACVSLKPMRMLSRAYTKPPLLLSLQLALALALEYKAQSAHKHTHTHTSIHVSIKIWCWMCSTYGWRIYRWLCAFVCVPCRVREALSLSFSCVRVCVCTEYNDALPLLSECQQLRVLADWLVEWLRNRMRQTEWAKESRIEQNRFGKSREWAGRDRPNKIFRRIAHRQFECTLYVIGKRNLFNATTPRTLSMKQQQQQ